MQNLTGTDAITTLAGGTQILPGGPVASQEAIKELGTNGGGFFNANSAHPFENPTPGHQPVRDLPAAGDPVLAAAHVRPMVGDKRQGYAILAVMAVLWRRRRWPLTELFEAAPRGSRRCSAAGAAMEGKEVRFGGPLSALFADVHHADLDRRGQLACTTRFTPLGGGVAMLNMMLGEIAPGGIGSGLYGILVLAVITVFVAGLMVGRTPEYLGKKIGGREMKLAAALHPDHPGRRADRHRRSRWRCPAGAGLDAQRRAARPVRGALRLHLRRQQQRLGVRRAHRRTRDFYNIALGLAMLLGRFLPIVFVLGLAGSLAAQEPVPATAGHAARPTGRCSSACSPASS